MGPATYRRRPRAFGVAFAAVRLPRPLQNGIDWLRSELSQRPRHHRPDRRRRGADRRAGGAGRDQPLRRERQRRDARGHDRGRNRQRSAGPGRDARVPSGRDSEHDQDQRARSDGRRRRRSPGDPSPGPGSRSRCRRRSSSRTTTGRPASPHRCSPGRPPGCRCWSAARDSVPDATTQALAQLHPQGGGPSGDTQVYSAGGAAVPSGLNSDQLHGDSPAEIANSIDQLRQRLLKARARAHRRRQLRRARLRDAGRRLGGPLGRRGSLQRPQPGAGRPRWRRCGATRPRPSTSSDRSP